jgi:hypothetical protein
VSPGLAGVERERTVARSSGRDGLPSFVD